jgi:hypothetical protein
MSAIAAEPRLPVVVATPPDRSQRSWWPTLAWVAVAALVLACIGLLRQNSALQQNLASLQARFSEQGSKLDQANDVVATLLDPEATKIELVAARQGDLSAPQSQSDFHRQQSSAATSGENLRALVVPRQRRRAHRSRLVQAGSTGQRDSRESSTA